MRIGQRIILGFLGVGLIVTITAIITVNPIRIGLDELGEFHAPSLDSVQRLESMVLNAVEESFAYIVSGKIEEKEDFFTLLKNFDAQAEKHRSIYEIEHPGVEKERILLEAASLYKKALMEKAIVMFNEYETTGSVGHKTFEEYEGFIHKFNNNIVALVNIEKGEVEEAHHLAIGTIKRSERVIYGIGVLAIIISLSLGVYISTSITRPIKTLSDAAGEIGKGKIDTPIEIRSRDEIGELAAAFSQMTAELHSSHEALRAAHEEMESFVYTVSHDLRTPIISQVSFAKILQEDYSDALDEEGKRYLRHVREGGEKLSEIVQNLLILSRAGMSLGHLETIDFSKLIKDVLHEMASILEDRGVECEITGGSVQITCDPERFSTVITNFVSNAVSYMGEQPNPRIEIGVNENKEEFQLYVRDNGIGIDPKYHEKIFELFQTLDSAHGTGVGLALVKKIIKIHGGRVWVESAVDEGSTFYFTLPKQLVRGGEPA